MASSAATHRIASYFFIVDFYHMREASDELDLLPESIVYFYPSNGKFKAQKLLDCGEIVGLMQYFNYDLFQSIPREFYLKKSLITCEHYGRHCAFLILPRDRFTSDEARLHLDRILALFHLLYGTWNRTQTTYPVNGDMHVFLQQSLTPIVDYVFNANRSIQNLFSAIRYIPWKQDNQRLMLNSKHFLNHLQSTFGMEHGLIAYRQRILYSNFDMDTTFYLQLLLGIQERLPIDLIQFPWQSKVKLNDGVSLIRLYIRRLTDKAAPSSSVDIIDRHSTDMCRTPSISDETTSTGYSLSTSASKYHGLSILEDPAGSSGETGFDTDQTDPISDPSSPCPDHRISKSTRPSKSDPSVSRLPRSTSISLNTSTDEEPSLRQEAYFNTLTKFDEELLFEPIRSDEYESGYDEKDVLVLPRANPHRGRTRTVTDRSELKAGDGDRHNGHAIWADIVERNDELEREEVVLYIQRNSRMMLAGVVKQSPLSDEYLRTLWLLIVSEMANMETEVHLLPPADQPAKLQSHLRFQCHENTRSVESSSDDARPTPSAENAYMAFTARSNLQRHPDRKMLGFSRGNESITVGRRLPHRLTFSCRRHEVPSPH